MIEERFTVRIKPLLGESLFSFMSRLALVNGLKLYKLLNIVKAQDIQIRPDNFDLINLYPKRIMDTKKIAFLSDLSEEKILSMSCYYLLQRFSDSLKISRARFIEGMFRNTVHYCPQCIKIEPHYKLIWSFGEIKICHLHKVTLKNRCMSCNKEISFKDIKELNICPYCKRNLSECSWTKYNDESKIDWQYWLYNAYGKAVTPGEIYLSPPDVALKIIYILNQCYPRYNRNVVEAALENKQKLITLLQRIRDSMDHSRVMHLSFVFKTLYENKISIDEFFNINPPNGFAESFKVNTKKIDRTAEAYCLAPWCTNYMKKGKLIKTGSEYKKDDYGNVSKCFMICPKCGCEYAHDINDKLYERTYFINSYNILKNQPQENWTINSLSNELGLKKEGVNRCLAYFNSRGLISNLYNRQNIMINTELLKKFIDAIKNGQGIVDIRKWSIWESYYHYLIHRLHIDVIMEMHRSHCNKDKKINIRNHYSILVKDTLDVFMEKNIDISIKAVCKQVNICSETASKYGLSAFIDMAKEKQKYKRISEIKNQMFSRLSEFILSHSSEHIAAGQIYSFLGIRREKLWRVAPELTAEIMELRKYHNKQITKSS